MLEEVISYINKKVAITLINGKEKSGTITGIDIDKNSIKLTDDTGSQASLLISIIGMIEPIIILNGNVNALDSKKEIISDIPVNGSTSKNEEIIQKITKFETLYETEIKNAVLSVSKPDFVTPVDIKRITYSAISEENRIFSNITNKYESGIKLGRLLPNSDELRAITNLVVTLSENPQLKNSASIYNYLGYFCYLNNNKVDTIKAYQKAAKLSNKPNEWFNLATVALEKGEYELACFSLEKLFLIVSCTDKSHEKAWYKFTELVTKFSAYSYFKTLIDKGLLKSEYEKIFETICYCLLKKGERKTVETLIKTSLSNDNFKVLVLEGLVYLPQQPLSSYLTFKLDFNKIVTFSHIPTSKPVIKHQVAKNTTSIPTKPKYVDILREARTARDITKDYEKAEKIFIEGIEKESNQTFKQGAIRDLASMLAQQMNQPQKAIGIIEKYQSTLTDQDWNLLYNFNFQLGNYEEAILIQEELLKNTQGKEQRVSRYNSLASCYFKLANYVAAERNYQNALKITPSNYSIKRNIALCLYQQNKKDSARKLLNEIIEEFSDVNAQKLLDKIEGRDTSNPIEAFINIGNENIDLFTLNYINSCDFKYVDKNRLSQEGKYIGSDDSKRFDLKKLEDAASTLKSRIAEERSNIYLNASKILFDLDEQGNDLYKYLCRSFASRGDSAVQSNSSVDSVKTYYLASLKIYDALYLDDNKNNKRDEQDAINALCRFLYSLLGRNKIPLSIENDKNLSIKETINDLVYQIKDTKKIFEAFCMIFARSFQFAMRRILHIISSNPDLKRKTYSFLQIPDNIDENTYFDKWKSEAIKIIKIENEISEQLNALKNFQISEIWLVAAIDKIKLTSSKVFFDSDKDYLVDLQRIFDNCISLYKATDYDEKNNKLDDFYLRTENFLTKIKKNPTKLSIEEIYPIAQNVLTELEKYRKNLFTNSKPELNFSNVFPAYQLKNGNRIDLQIRIENQAEGHAEDVELYLAVNPIYLKINSPSIIISYNTIRGLKGDSKIIELELTQEAIQEKAFSLQVKATFKNRLNETFTTPAASLPIQLGEQKDFIEIKPNPFANGASGKAVANDDMFYGRSGYIESAYKTMVEDGVSYVIYGQFRSGKSSVLTHLEKKLEANPQIIVAKLGDVGTFMGSESQTSMFYRFLHRILRALGDGVKKKERDRGLAAINFPVPNSKTFYEHPSPEDYFYELMDSLQNQKLDLVDWQNIRIIVSMDEFSYIYGQIVQGKLSADFMKSWKALLAKDYFNVVLVAQDVFPKFFAQYENAFGTIFPKRITYLDDKSAKELIDEPIKRLNKNESKFRENAIEKIIELTDGHPWYIQIFCNTLVNYINSDKQPYITGANIDKVKESLLRGTDRKDNFKNFIENGDPSTDRIPDKDFIKILKKIAEHTKNDEYCTVNLLTNCNTSVTVNEVLKDLESREVIATHGEKGYKIRVGLFKEWLNENPNVWE